MHVVDMAPFIDLYINPTGVVFREGYAHREAVTIGGQTREGEDAINDLTSLFLESRREFPLNYPDLAARIHSRPPERFLYYEVALTVKDGSGFPKLINDEEVVFLNTVKGCPVDEALDYAVSGCTETRMPNRDTCTSGCVSVNFATALEMTLYNKLKRACIDWMVPQTDLAVRMGIQAFRPPYFALDGPTVLTADGAGITASYKINDSTSVTGFRVPVGRDNISLTNKDYALEMGLRNTCKIYDHLSVNLEASYVHLMPDKPDDTWGLATTGGGKRGIRDAWNVSALFIYSFQP